MPFGLRLAGGTGGTFPSMTWHCCVSFSLTSDSLLHSAPTALGYSSNRHARRGFLRFQSLDNRNQEPTDILSFQRDEMPSALRSPSVLRRQPNRESGTLPGFALNGNLTTLARYKHLADRQP